MSVQIFVADAGTGGNSGETLKAASVLGEAIETSVSSNTKTTVVTISAAVDTFITQVFCSGMENGKWFLTVDSVDQIISRAGGGDRNVVFEFTNPFRIASGSVLDVKVIHFVTGQTPDFESSVMGYT